MIFDALTYSIITVGLVLTYVVFHLARSKSPRLEARRNINDE